MSGELSSGEQRAKQAGPGETEWETPTPNDEAPEQSVEELRRRLERLEAEKKDLNSELQVQRQLVDAVDQAIIVTGPDGRVTHWNRFAEQLYGWTREEALGKSILDLTPSSQSREQGEAIMVALQRGERWSGLFEVQDRSGRVFPAWVVDSPIRRSDGTLSGIVGVSADISSLIDIEKGRQYSETRFQTLFQECPIAMQVFSPSGDVIAANPAWEKLWEARSRDLEGYNILQDPTAIEQGVLEWIERVKRGETVHVPPFHYDPSRIGRPGRARWINSYVYPVLNAEKQLSEFVLIAYDVTSIYEADRERSMLLERESAARKAAEDAQRRVAFLAEASRVLSSSLDYRVTLGALSHLVSPFLADWCSVSVLEGDNIIRRVGIAHPDPARQRMAEELGDRYPIRLDAPGGIGKVIRTGQPEIYLEVPEEVLAASAADKEHLALLKGLGLRSAISLPLRARERTIGALTLVYAESGRRYSADDIALAEDLALRAAAAIDNSMLYSEAQQAIQRHIEVEQKLALLSDATGTVLGSLNVDAVLSEVIALASKLVPADAYAIWRKNPARGQWELVGSRGLSESYQKRVSNYLTHSMEAPSAPLVMEDLTQNRVSTEGHLKLLHGEGIGAMLVQPLRSRSLPSGTLVCYYRQPHQFTEVELRVTAAVANLAGSALAIAELYEATFQQANELAEADRLKNEFMAMLAHELRNPLAAIRNALYVLSATNHSESAADRAQEVVERQTGHMTSLVDQLLDVSRVSRGRIDAHLRRMDLSDLTRTTVEDHRQMVAAAGLCLTEAIPPEPVWADVDPTRFRQAVGNLLQNAAKYTERGGSVELGLEVDPEKGEIRIQVSDTGIGIDPSLLPRLFEPFVQADRSLARTQGGLGLGLTLVRTIAGLHGGEVSASSAGIGHGATFTLQIPLKPAPSDAPAPDPLPSHSAAICRVLVIEDNRDAAETLRDLLELSGHEVSVAYTGPEGLDLLRRLRPDITLCDLGLPGMDGFEVARAVRSDPDLSASRILALSGYAREEDRQRSMDAGFNGHIAKPVDPAALLSIVSHTGGEV